MNNSDIQILNILSCAMNGGQIEKITNWPEVLKELKKQAVFCLPYDIIKKHGSLAKTDAVAYQRMCYQNIGLKYAAFERADKNDRVVRSE